MQSLLVKKVKRNKRKSNRPPNELCDLVSVGPKTLEDFHILGIHSLNQLKDQDAQTLYDRLCRIKEVRVDRCCEDVFRSAIEQANNPNLPVEEKVWWYWTQRRKERQGKES